MKDSQLAACYGSAKGMLRKYEKYAQQDRFSGTSKAEFEHWRRDEHATLHRLLGFYKMERPNAEDILLERVVLADGTVREKVLVCTEPDIFMPCYILIPPNPNGTVFLALHGHNGGGKEAVAGLRTDPAVAKAIDYYNYDCGYQLAKLGFVAVCPDCRGFGERRDETVSSGEMLAPLGSSCFQLTHMAEGLGETVAGMLLWDNMMLIDYLERRGNGIFPPWAALDFPVAECKPSGWRQWMTG